MSKENLRVGKFTPTESEIEEARENGTLDSLMAKFEAANAKIAEGQEPELVLEADAELSRLMEEREKIKEAERVHDEMEPVEASDLGSEIDREMAEEEPNNDEEIAAQ